MKVNVQNRQQLLVVLTVALMGLLIADWIVIEPLARLWTARAHQITELRSKVRDGRMLARREAALRSQWSEVQSNALPANSSQAEQQALRAFDNWSRYSGCELASVMPQLKNDSTNYMTLNCRVEAKGTLGTLSQFVYSIERDPMALKLDSVELSASDNTGQQLSLGLQISGLMLLSQ
jgi:Tfp pilus assembly protein PilO